MHLLINGNEHRASLRRRRDPCRVATAIADAILFTLSHFDLSRRPSRHSGIGSSLSYLLVVIIKGFQLYFGSRCDQRRAAFPQHAADCMVKP